MNPYESPQTPPRRDPTRFTWGELLLRLLVLVYMLGFTVILDTGFLWRKPSLWWMCILDAGMILVVIGSGMMMLDELIGGRLQRVVDELVQQRKEDET